jgi:ribosomal protein S18 acetylase RimI-like enzyme
MAVRPARADDVPQLTQVLARAFDDDPVTRWVYGDGAGRARWSSKFFAWQLRRLTPQEVTWTTEAREGAALWALPDRWRETTWEMLRLVAATLPGVLARAPRVLQGLGQVEARHPGSRHLYLAVLGVDPERQGDGVGSALLRPGLEICDREALPAYLETGKERNVAFYGRHGFRVTEKLDLPNGPPIWLMWRDPA